MSDATARELLAELVESRDARDAAWEGEDFECIGPAEQRHKSAAAAARAYLAKPAEPLRHADTGEQPSTLPPREQRLREVIEWALGERDEFPDWPESVTITGNPKYWWRKELRARYDAALQGERNV